MSWLRVKLGKPQSEAELAAVKELFEEYARSLSFSLAFQDFEKEMATFPDKYAPPSGALLLEFLGRPRGGGSCRRPTGSRS